MESQKTCRLIFVTPLLWTIDLGISIFWIRLLSHWSQTFMMSLGIVLSHASFFSQIIGKWFFPLNALVIRNPEDRKSKLVFLKYHVLLLYIFLEEIFIFNLPRLMFLLFVRTRWSIFQIRPVSYQPSLLCFSCFLNLSWILVSLRLWLSFIPSTSKEQRFS